MINDNNETINPCYQIYQLIQVDNISTFEGSSNECERNTKYIYLCVFVSYMYIVFKRDNNLEEIVTEEILITTVSIYLNFEQI